MEPDGNLVRVNWTLPPATVEQVKERAKLEHRSTSNMAAVLLIMALEVVERQDSIRGQLNHPPEGWKR